MARHLHATGLPTVNVSGRRFASFPFPQVTTDLEAAGRLSADFLMDLGLRHFAYHIVQSPIHMKRHRRAFADAVEAAGFRCDLYRSPGDALEAESSSERAELRRWLGRLSKPVGILCGHGSQLAIHSGRWVIDACRNVGLHVPEDVAVLSGDDDDLLSEVCHPPMSGVAVASEHIGQQAAAMLHRLMSGKPTPEGPVLLKPSGVIPRQSTDVVSVDDPHLATAIRFIRDHAHEQIQVMDVVKVVPLSRRSLEYRFVQALDRTPGAEIRRVRLARAKRLLADSDFTVGAVATAAGFGSAEYLSQVFRTDVGVTPSCFRSEMRSPIAQAPRRPRR